MGKCLTSEYVKGRSVESQKFIATGPDALTKPSLWPLSQDRGDAFQSWPGGPAQRARRRHGPREHPGAVGVEVDLDRLAALERESVDGFAARHGVGDHAQQVVEGVVLHH